MMKNVSDGFRLLENKNARQSTGILDLRFLIADLGLSALRQLRTVVQMPDQSVRIGDVTVHG
jgi:hypothetical protein